MAKSISLFNHKGGVSKTTTTLNLGWILAEKGKRVLIIDLDSQCNLTGLILGMQAIDEDHLEQFYDNRNNLTMKQIVASLIEGNTPTSFMDSKPGELFKTKNKNLFLLPGHLDVSDLDSQISVSLKVARGIPATKNVPGNLPEIFNKIAEKNNIDYVLYDLSPSVGGLNEVMLMSSNYFIVPTSPDFFCLQAVGSLAKNFKNWHKEIEDFKKDNGFNNHSYSITNEPCFLGTVQQRYRPRGGEPSKSFQKWIDKIRDEINSNLIKALSEISPKCFIKKEIVEDILKQYEGNLSAYDLAHISDFNSLIAKSQELSKPIFELTDNELGEIVWGQAKINMTESRDNFKKLFNDFGDRIIKLTNL